MCGYSPFSKTLKKKDAGKRPQTNSGGEIQETQETGTTEQWQIRLEIIAAPQQQETLCLLNRTSYQDTCEILWRFHKIVKEGPPKGSYKILIQEPPNSIPEEFIQAPLTQSIFKIFMQRLGLLMDFTRISHKIFSQGPVQDQERTP